MKNGPEGGDQSKKVLGFLSSKMHENWNEITSYFIRFRVTFDSEYRNSKLKYFESSTLHFKKYYFISIFAFFPIITLHILERMIWKRLFSTPQIFYLLGQCTRIWFFGFTWSKLKIYKIGIKVFRCHFTNIFMTVKKNWKNVAC